jgi:hypothetical protein
LNARQCREACGLRAKNEPLTTNATLQRTTRTTKYEDAMCANARKTRQTAKRTKGNNAGQPGTASRCFATRSQDVKRAKRYEGIALPPNAGVKRRRSRPP